MAWDFETEPAFQRELDWIDAFVRDEIEPLDLVLGNPFDVTDERAREIVKPLKQRVKERGLWACHLDPELGGLGYGQLKLALMNEILGRSRWAPSTSWCRRSYRRSCAARSRSSSISTCSPNWRSTR